MLSVMGDMGVKVEKHHHEVAPAQHELGINSTRSCKTADNMQIYKYVVHNVAHAYGKTATFMPKPIKGDNGSGMHVHQSLWKGGRPTLRRQRLCRSVGDGALLHRRHHQACQGAQRLHQPDDQQLQAPDPRLRGAGAAGLFLAQPLGVLPHPLYREPQGQAGRGAFPDPAANPYLAFAAMLMAGLDGIQNKIHPGDPMDKNLYDLPPEELTESPWSAARCARPWANCGRPRLPDEGRRLHHGPDRGLYRTEVEEVYAYEHTPHPSISPCITPFKV